MSKRYAKIAITLLALFAIWAALVLSGITQHWEDGVYRGIAPYISPQLTFVAIGISWLCNPSTVVGICLLLLLLPPLRVKVALPVILTAAGSAALNHLLKHLFGRERPSILRLVTETSPSFPSGHSMTSAAVCIAVLLLLRHAQPFRGRRPIQCVFAALPLLIGVSRIYLGVHHAGDVLGGWLLGAACGLFIYILYTQKLRPRLTK